MDNGFLLVANWKANTPEISNFKFQIFNEKIEVAIAPQFPEIEKIPPEFSRCAQDVSQFVDGAHTGEVTAKELKTLDVKYVLIGHSERRSQFNQSNEEILEKISRAQEQGLTVILCANNESEIVGRPEYIMYEPKTAISTPGNFHPESPENVKSIIDAWKNKYDARFLYGGSINPENAQVYAQIENVSGFVIGQASLDPISLKEIYDNVSKIKQD